MVTPMSYRNFALPTFGALLVLFFFMLVIFLPFMIIGLIGRALSNFGLSWGSFIIFLFVSLIGSTINLPVWRSKVASAVQTVEYVYFFGMRYPVPTTSTRFMESVISINFGGAIMPVLLSVYLLLMNPQAVVPSLAAIPIVSAILYFAAKPVRGVGIVTPLFIPPIVAAIVGIILGGFHSPVVAYVAGTIGCIVGADLLHLGSLDDMGAVNLSIGGAGTFDGIFLTGLLAALLAF